jgi:hypothetical protein
MKADGRTVEGRSQVKQHPAKVERCVHRTESKPMLRVAQRLPFKHAGKVRKQGMMRGQLTRYF